MYGGFVLESTLNEQNAIDEFSAAVTVGSPAQMVADPSTNNQIGSIGEQLPNPLTVIVSDSAGNPVPNVPITFEVSATSDAIVSSPSPPDGNIRIEAEHGKFNSPLEVRSDPNAAGGKYVIYPVGVPGDAADTFYVNIPQARTYYMWVRSLQNSTRDK